MSASPLAPLEGRTTEQIEQYLDDHLTMALRAAYMLGQGDTEQAENQLLLTLASISLDCPDEAAVAVRDAERRQARLRDLMESRRVS
jgi:hypothetical protein